jgi:hypothetical protein
MRRCTPLADLRLISPPPRSQLLGKVRDRLGHAVPGARVIAESVLGADSAIDFVALEPNGRVVVVLVGGHGEDLELVARGLAQRAWVSARIGDWRQLAPGLGIRPDSEVRALLACPAYDVAARTAIAALGPAAMAAVTYRCVQNGAEFEVLLEHLATPENGAAASPPSPVRGFRTHLTDADLGLTPAEMQEFE